MSIMVAPAEILGTYLHLAQASARRRRLHVRDRLLVIAGSISHRLNLTNVAAYCRLIVLAHNRHHMIRRWSSFAVALNDPDFLHFLKQLQRQYPQEKAERMLAELGIEMGRERETYYSDEEYAAALLGTDPQAIARQLSAADPPA